MSGAGLLVVGASQAGVQLACSVRELGWDGPVTLVGAEPHPPYARPPLSKAYLHGSATRESLRFRDPGFYEREGIGLVLGETVERIEFDVGGAGVAHAASGRRFVFDRLVLATGARPRTLPVEGAGLAGVLVLRDVEDAERLRARLRQNPDVVVIGGGFVGLEVGGTAAALGCRVTVVEAGPALLGRVVSAPTAAIVGLAHEMAGVEVLTGTRPARIVGGSDGRVTAVDLADGSRLPADLVLVGIGAQPADRLAREAGLDCDDGVVVDAFSLASDGHTLAVGDCANLPDPSPVPGPHPRLRLESVDNAVEQARSAATTVIGEPVPYRGVPWFWSDQAGAKLQIAGLAAVSDEVAVRPGSRPGQITVLRYREDRLVAAECVNAPADFLTVRKALAAGVNLPRAAAAVGGRLKDLLAVVSG